MDAHPGRARQYGVRYGLVRGVLTQGNVGVLVLFWVLGYIPHAAAVLALISSLYTLASLASGATPRVVVLGLAWCLPLGAHWTLMAHYARAQAAWAAHVYGLHDAPQLPRAAPHDVVALLGGAVWALPVWHLLCLTTERLSLPTEIRR